MANKMEREQELFWDAAAGKFEKQVSFVTGDSMPDARYGPFGFEPGENELNLLGDLSGKKVLVLGSGTGRAAVAFAKAGAEVVAIDISSRQVELAKEIAKTKNVSVDIRKQSFNDLSIFKEGEFDAVFSSYALQYADNINHVFNQVARVLKAGGRFAFSLDHPDFLTVNQETGRREHTPFGQLDIEVPWFPIGTLPIMRHKTEDIESGLKQSGFNVLDRMHISVWGISEIIKAKMRFGGTKPPKEILTTSIFQAEKPQRLEV